MSKNPRHIDLSYLTFTARQAVKPKHIHTIGKVSLTLEKGVTNRAHYVVTIAECPKRFYGVTPEGAIAKARAHLRSVPMPSGGFIKPKPTITLQPTKSYTVAELQQLLSQAGVKAAVNVIGFSSTLPDMQDHTDLRVEIQHGLIAARAWDIVMATQGPQLTSLTMRADSEWVGPFMKADQLPTPSNSSGIYCVPASPTIINDLIKIYSPSVVGFIELLGRVIEHQRGYRAEACMIRRLVICKPEWEWPPIMSALAETYQCEVLPWKSANL